MICLTLLEYLRVPLKDARPSRNQLPAGIYECFKPFEALATIPIAVYESITSVRKYPMQISPEIVHSAVQRLNSPVKLKATTENNTPNI